MKAFKCFLLSLFVVLIGATSVSAAASNFEVFTSMQPDITENKVRVVLGFDGEEVMAVKETISYDTNKLSLVEVSALDNFNVVKSDEKKDGKYATFNVLADSEYSFLSTNFCVLVFEVKPGFKVNSNTDIFVYDASGSGPEEIKYRFRGSVINMKRLSASEMSYLEEAITDKTKKKFWFVEHSYMFIVGGIFLLAVIMVILVMPSRRKKERRDDSIEDSIRANNYVPGSSNIKIDQAAIDAIGKVERPIDMTQAIIVNEDVKPFGDIVGKFEGEEIKKEDNQFENIGMINVFEQRNPDSYEEHAKVEEVETLPEDQKVTAGVDIKPVIDFPTNDELQMISVNTLEDVSSKMQEIDPFNVNLTSVDAKSEEEKKDSEIEMPKLAQVNGDEKKENKGSTNALILLLIVVSGFTSVAYAEPSVSDMRLCIVNNEYVKEFDYNDDGKVDVLDLVSTKDFSNCNFESLLIQEPGFAELHGESNNLISTDSNFVRPTKRPSKTTTKRAGSTSADSGKTTSKKVTTKKPNEDGTIRTTTKTQVDASTVNYNVSISTTNGTVSSDYFTLTSSKTRSITLIPNEGYKVDRERVSCNNISYSFSSNNRMILSKPTGDASCSVGFIVKNDIRVTLRNFKGNGNSNVVNPAISYSSTSYDNNGQGTFNQTWLRYLPVPDGYKLKEAPSCGSYTNGTFSLKVPANNTSCNLYFDPILYDLKVYLPNQSSAINTGTLSRIFFDESKKVTFMANVNYSRVTCNGLALKLSKSGTNAPYSYSFTYKHKSASTAICQVS